jgi:nicotinate-nucleotide--dimethylbenzimidazole phosphoribosyltransferase
MTNLSLPEIPALDGAATAAARVHLDRLTKPAGSLGRIEDIAAWLAGVQAKPLPSLPRRAIFVVAADHGVTAHGVSAYPSEVTGQMVANFLAGGAAINVLARAANAQVYVVDAGVRSVLPDAPGLLSRRIGDGTADFTAGPAMTLIEARRCIETGMDLALGCEADVIGCGEMGIGNTTAASAVVAAVLGQPARRVTGRGTGVDARAFRRKLFFVEQALALHQPLASDPLDMLAKVGGFEIGVLAGLMIGSAALRRAVLVDGFISGAAALIAASLAPRVVDYMAASHLSTEPGHRLTLDHLGLDPLLDLGLRLGEGTGAALAIPLLDAACRILAEMATFDAAGVSGKEDRPNE